MQPIPRFPFANLSTELVLLILTFAARPDFARTHEEKNPYSSAITLCRVSRITRHAVLPQLLHTVLLSEESNVTSFMNALRMQELYRQQINHLYFAYAAHVRRIWIGQICAPPPAPPIHGSFPPNTPVYNTSEPDIDFSILAPVIFGAQSLALDFASLFLLCGCLECAWNTHPARSTPPWSTKTLALSGNFTRWLPLTSTTEGSAFLASISHLIFLYPVRFKPYYTICSRLDPCFDDVQSPDYSLPAWMTNVPWAAFKNIQAVSLPFPHVVLMFDNEEPVDLHVELVTLSASPDHSDFKNISSSIRSGEARVSLVDVRFAWEEAWACGLSPVSMHKLPRYPLDIIRQGPSEH
ncbi:hypothetical protein K503DRAFT_550309 [Rhizopogon vinicolor AM-OR11-026]|uniref:F-box domain-containing protein n=1 Tax=Rhizopogon vinicolor AM-OR11-026 TaxID=1314800 RepID=A0A1B7MKJ6_9AGAM|nr:hypothetical protein K503DRAFT_550309 [Rhizopogon vinicolor AM-OR11-026]